jgi:dihydroflavonol-4-reductase
VRQRRRAAWRFVESAKVAWDLVAINPSLVVGPSLVAARNTSTAILTDLYKGAYLWILNLAWSFVDVRDVALAHLKAVEVSSASGRYVCAGETLDMRALVAILSTVGTGKLPSIRLPDAVVRLASYLQPKGVGSYLRHLV